MSDHPRLINTFVRTVSVDFTGIGGGCVNIDLHKDSDPPLWVLREAVRGTFEESEEEQFYYEYPRSE